jgi:hypothetical protein
MTGNRDLLQRIRLFLRHRHVSWQDTARPLPEEDFAVLDARGRSRRERALMELDMQRQLQSLRRKMAALEQARVPVQCTQHATQPLPVVRPSAGMPLSGYYASTSGSML